MKASYLEMVVDVLIMTSSVVTSTFTPISFFISLYNIIYIYIFRFRHNLQYHNLQKLFHFGVSLGNASVVTRWKAQVIQ